MAWWTVSSEREGGRARESYYMIGMVDCVGRERGGGLGSLITRNMSHGMVDCVVRERGGRARECYYMKYECLAWWTV